MRQIAALGLVEGENMLLVYSREGLAGKVRRSVTAVLTQTNKLVHKKSRANRAQDTEIDIQPGEQHTSVELHA